MSPDMFYPGCKVHGRSSVLLGGPDDEEDEDEDEENLSERDALNPVSAAMDAHSLNGVGVGFGFGGSRSPPPPPLGVDSPAASMFPPYDHSNCSEQLHKSCACVNFIAEHTKAREEATKVR